MFQVVDGEVIVAGEADEVVLVTLMVTHEDILAMHAAVIAPPAFSLLNRFALGMVVYGIGNMVRMEVVLHRLLAVRWGCGSGHDYRW